MIITAPKEEKSPKESSNMIERERRNGPETVSAGVPGCSDSPTVKYRRGKKKTIRVFPLQHNGGKKKRITTQPSSWKEGGRTNTRG